METYAAAVPALDPLASGFLESPARAIEAGQPLDEENVIASKRQLEWREEIASKHPRFVRNTEVVAAERRHHVVKSLHFDLEPDGQHVPRWAQELRTEMAEMRTEVRESITKTAEMRTEVRESRTEMAEMHTEMRREIRGIAQGVQQAKNRGLKFTDEPLTPVIRLQDGTVPLNVPATMLEVITTNSHTIEGLLQFYGLGRRHTS